MLDLEGAAAPGSPRGPRPRADDGDGSDLGDAHASVAAGGVGEDEELSDNVLDTARLAHGDIDAALAGSQAVVRGRFTTPWMYQGYLEPQTATAWVEPDGELVGRSSTQAPFATRDSLAKLFGLPVEQVRVRAATLGGALRRQDDDHRAARGRRRRSLLRRPVRLAMTRSEDIEATNPAGAEMLTLEIGADAEGKLTGIRSRVLVDRGTHRRLRRRVDRRACWPPARTAGTPRS